MAVTTTAIVCVHLKEIIHQAKQMKTLVLRRDWDLDQQGFSKVRRPPRDAQRAYSKKAILHHAPAQPTRCATSSHHAGPVRFRFRLGFVWTPSSFLMQEVRIWRYTRSG
jgi:hypothetical protein